MEAVNRSKFSILCLVAATAILGWYREALAYRPFESTDASVAKPGEIEIELAPLGYLQSGADHILVAPSTVLNMGLADGWEAVVEGRGETVLNASPRQTSFVDDQISLKHVVRNGSLQDSSGPSIAVELAALLPEVNGNRGVGFAALGIVSQRWNWGTLHLNAQAELSREHRADIFLGTIAEGPEDWKVRPVAELVYEREFGRSERISGLVGAIWQVKDSLAVDIGVRHGRESGQTENEIRLGVTFAFNTR